MVYWVVDEEGGRGKSVLCKYLMENYAAFVSGEEARYQDIMSAYDPAVYSNVVVLHYVRANSEHFCYAALESFKVSNPFPKHALQRIKPSPHCL